MKQRLGLAAAMLHHPQLLILDEPTNGLDPARMREMRQLLRQLTDSGTAVSSPAHILQKQLDVLLEFAG